MFEHSELNYKPRGKRSSSWRRLRHCFSFKSAVLRNLRLQGVFLANLSTPSGGTNREEKDPQPREDEGALGV